MSMEQLTTFWVDQYFFGVEVVKVQEVIVYQTMTRVPLAPSVVGGLINLRGQIVTAVDLRKQLGLSDLEASILPMNVVIRDGDHLVSLLVDEIGDVVSVSSEDLKATPSNVSSVVRELVRGVYPLKKKLLLSLDIHKVMCFNPIEAEHKI